MRMKTKDLLLNLPEYMYIYICPCLDGVGGRGWLKGKVVGKR